MSREQIFSCAFSEIFRDASVSALSSLYDVSELDDDSVGLLIRQIISVPFSRQFQKKGKEITRDLR